MADYDKVFASVFPTASEVDIPTPAATPVLDSSAFGEPFGSPISSQASAGFGASEQVKWDRAWHTATAFLSLPNEPIKADEDEKALNKKWIKPCPTQTQRALQYVLVDDSRGKQLRTGKDDLLRWYFEDVIVGHCVEHVFPELTKILEQVQAPDALFEVGKILHVTQVVYLRPLKNIIARVLPHGGRERIHQFEEDLHGLFRYSLPQDQVTENLSRFFRHDCSLVLNVARDDGMQHAPELDSDVRQRMLRLTRNLQSVGLGGHQAQRMFAEVMSETLASYIKSTYSGKWTSPSIVVEQLHNWIENDFARFIVEVLASIQESSDAKTEKLTDVTHADVERWQEMGINQLGTLRTDELFDIIVEWDDSRGAIEDLKRYVTVPSSRTYLTSHFSGALSYRLLQPGASTNEILQVYISVIRAFTVLDPKGVLLDRVARPIRRYLRERDDTVTIVVGGLLADPNDEVAAGDALVELAVEMARSNNVNGDDDPDDADIDFDDMNWMADPVDAGPEYSKSKKSDVIGSLISLFESKDVFVKEFQKILGERLLKKEYDFDREIRVLELLKLRFGEAALQACEVMLRDILDSRRVDAFIHKDESLTLTPTLHARILSHLFWPSLHTETFLLPPDITTLQTHYSTAFSTLKQSRKLTWLPALGQVTVTLDLADRTVTEECQTWQASVIHAFQPTPTDDPSTPITRTFSSLLSTLEISPPLLTQALTFWIGKLILKQTSDDEPIYTVLETLATEAAAHPGTLSAATAAAAETATAAAAPAVLSEHEVAREKMEVYSQYVVGMLTNGGAMPLQQIVMMLKLTVPGGFPFAGEELRGFLEGEVKGGRLDYVGGAYKIKH